MVRKNQQTVFRKKRKKFFTGVKKQDSVMMGTKQ